MVNISLLLPTRGRPQLVSRLLDSLAETTTDLKNLEVILYVDEDDVESHMISDLRLAIVKLVRPPGEKMGEITCACYGASQGRYVMLMNDDAVFKTRGWDDRVVQAFAQFPDDIALVYGNDLDQGKAVPTFPIVSRTVCEVIGEICPKGYYNLHIESHLFDIFKQLSRLGHKRIVYLEDVVFEHMHYAVGKAVKDETYTKKNKQNDDILFISLNDERYHTAVKMVHDIEKLGKGLNDAHSTRASEKAYKRSKFSVKGILKRVFTPYYIMIFKRRSRNKL